MRDVHRLASTSTTHCLDPRLDLFTATVVDVLFRPVRNGEHHWVNMNSPTKRRGLVTCYIDSASTTSPTEFLLAPLGDHTASLLPFGLFLSHTLVRCLAGRYGRTAREYYESCSGSGWAASNRNQVKSVGGLSSLFLPLLGFRKIPSMQPSLM
jgi:hypothetical protein